ncbi:MAG: hypothetical protein WA782_16785 [Sulfitobacter sp.]
MADDLKAVTKMVADMEKRMKHNEDRIKVLVDSMTSSKDIDKALAVHFKKMNQEIQDSTHISMKSMERKIELSDKLADAREKEAKRSYEQQIKMVEEVQKDQNKIGKDAVRQAEMAVLKSRVATLEAQVKALSK